jgi:hypothetical protein
MSATQNTCQYYLTQDIELKADVPFVVTQSNFSSAQEGLDANTDSIHMASQDGFSFPDDCEWIMSLYIPKASAESSNPTDDHLVVKVHYFKDAYNYESEQTVDSSSVQNDQYYAVYNNIVGKFGGLVKYTFLSRTDRTLSFGSIGVGSLEVRRISGLERTRYYTTNGENQPMSLLVLNNKIVTYKVPASEPTITVYLTQDNRVGGEKCFGHQVHYSDAKIIKSSTSVTSVAPKITDAYYSDDLTSYTVTLDSANPDYNVNIYLAGA